MNGPVFVSSIVERYTWASDLALVGHEHAVSVAACSPQWFQRGDQPPVSVVALGAQDQTVSVWVTGIPRPLLVARDLFERHVIGHAVVRGWLHALCVLVGRHRRRPRL